ncbi:MAG: Gfo/Idh/MocA family protein, partial [Alphaproteobacteria bacterium]
METHNRFNPVVGFDTSPTARAALTEQSPGVSSVSDFQTLLERDDIDVLYVSTPPASHAHYVRQGIAKGWKIFCEKPLGVDVADSERLAEEMNASGLGQAVNFVYSGAPAALRARQLISEGVIGDIVGAELDVRLSRWPRAFQA